MIIFIGVYKQVMSSIDNSACNDASKKPTRTYNKCDYIMLSGLCPKNCVRGRTRCGAHYEKPQKNQMCLGGCGLATASKTGHCIKCGQNRRLQHLAHVKRMNPVSDESVQQLCCV